MTSEVKIQPEININQDFELERLRINPTAEINEPPVYCKIGTAPAMTAGNFSLLNGKQKSGKTFFSGATVASLLTGEVQVGCVRGCLPENKKVVVVFDTEQSPYHALRSIKRICKLAGDPNPENLHAYGLRPLTPAERLKFIEDKINSTEGLGVVVIDGIRDLLTIGINDEQEATALVSKFLKWTADFEIHIILLLHQNKTDNHARGHVGTEVLNKSETTITITKEQNQSIFAVTCDYSRDIGFEDFAFTINDEGLPVSTELPEAGQTRGNTPQNLKDEEHIEKLNIIFSNERKMSGADLQLAIKNQFEVGIVRSRDFVYHYQINGWIEKEREGKNVYYVYKRAIF